MLAALSGAMISCRAAAICVAQGYFRGVYSDLEAPGVKNPASRLGEHVANTTGQIRLHRTHCFKQSGAHHHTQHALSCSTAFATECVNHYCGDQ